MFPDVDHVRDMQKELDEMIQRGVFHITRLLRNAETGVTETGAMATSLPIEEEEDHVMAARIKQAQRKKVWVYTRTIKCVITPCSVQI